MKEKIIINTDETQADDSTEDDARVIEVNKGGVAELHEKDERQMPSGPDVPYDVTETHSSTLDKPDADMASEAAEHEVAMREAKKKAGFIREDAYYNITSQCGRQTSTPDYGPKHNVPSERRRAL